jgi:hypothetical protein
LFGIQVVRKAIVIENGSKLQIHLLSSDIEKLNSNPSLQSNILIESCYSIIHSSKVKFRSDIIGMELDFSSDSWWKTDKKTSTNHFGIQVENKNILRYYVTYSIQRIVMFSSKRNDFGVVIAECYDYEISNNILSMLSIIEEEPSFNFENIYESISISKVTLKLKKLLGISLTNEYKKIQHEIKMVTKPLVEEFYIYKDEWKKEVSSTDYNYQLQKNRNGKFRIVIISPAMGYSIKPICEFSQSVASVMMELFYILENEQYSFEVLWYRVDQIENYCQTLFQKLLEHY